MERAAVKTGSLPGGTPSESARSYGPTNMASIPGTAAMRSACSSAALPSICTMTHVERSSSPSGSRSASNFVSGEKPRSPRGGSRAWSTTARARSAESTWGAMMPCAPMSRTLPINPVSSPQVRTSIGRPDA